jgi:hypothetical protein
MGKLHWQNVVAPLQNETQQSNGKAALAAQPQNKTQQSNGKARAQRQNAALQKRCHKGLAERSSAAAERKHNNQMGKRGTGRTL